LLDEPTNHLDAATASLISSALSDFEGIGIMVSHDRAFTDSLCKRTVYLYNESRAFAGGRDCIVCDTYPCGLSKALELRQCGQEQLRNDWEKADNKVAVEKQRSAALEAENQKARARLSKKVVNPGDHDTCAKIDAARVSGKDRNTGEAKARLESQIGRTETKRDSIKKSLRRKEGFSVEKTDFAKPIVIDGTCIIAGDYSLDFPDIEIKRGTKIALTGQNGAGKTLFVRHIIELLKNNGRSNELLYLPQEISDEQRVRILGEFCRLEEAERGEVLSTLFRLGSEPERLNHLQNDKVYNISDIQLSPGELRKLMIAIAVQRPLSLLIMDEPTNHMDITSVMALENALAALDCAMLVVSHDKAFLDKITNVMLVAERNDLKGKITKI
jgi:ATPase subunit of ABC transporter with duplicated ATPase domains